MLLQFHGPSLVCCSHDLAHKTNLESILFFVDTYNLNYLHRILKLMCVTQLKTFCLFKRNKTKATLYALIKLSVLHNILKLIS